MLAREQERRAASPRGDVENTRLGSEPENSPEPQELLLRGRILDLVHRLGDDEVAGDHGRII